MTFDEIINEKYIEYITVKTEIERITERKNELIKTIKKLQEAKTSYTDGLCKDANLCNHCLNQLLCETYGDVK